MIDLSKTLPSTVNTILPAAGAGEATDASIENVKVVASTTVTSFFLPLESFGVAPAITISSTPLVNS